jgi:cytochrome oxidase Cu insertion factor (SCO1/SenC/PrrC family)
MRKSLKAIIIALLFIGSYGLAWLFYQNGHDWLGSKVNHGELLPAAVSLNGEVPHYTPGKWTLLYVLPGHCEAVCLKNLYQIHQLYIALGKNATRVQRLVAHDIAEAALPVAQQEVNMPWVHAPLSHFIRRNSNVTLPSSGKLFIVDPHGMIILAYQDDVVPKSVYKDLERLFQASLIG